MSRDYSNLCQWYSCAREAEAVVELTAKHKATLRLEVCDKHMVDAILYLDKLKQSPRGSGGWVIVSPLMPF